MLELVQSALFALGPTIAAVAAWKRAGHTNRAVNSRGPEPTIYELVAETRGDVRSLHNRIERVETRLDRMEDR